MNDVFSIRAAGQRSITSADQVELRAISAGLAVPDAGVLDERLSGELDDLETADIAMEPWQQQDVQLEDEVGSIRDELKRRADLMGERYPFTLAGGTLSYVPSKSGFYEYCLGIATTSNSIQANPYTELPRSFERITTTILQKHLGPQWEALHTGWPRDDGQPKRCDEMVKNISKLTCDEREWVWSPKAGYPAENPNVGDLGMDFVVWRRSPDKRVGQLFVVGQCACGNDWGNKFNDLKVEKLEPWMRPFSYVPIARAFATPFMLSEGNFLVAHELAGWVLDRARLTIMAEEAVGDDEFDAHLPKLRAMFELSAAA